jgi:hypothetical protein
MHTLFLNLTNILLVTRFHDLCPSKIFLCCRNTCGLYTVNNSSPDLARHVSHQRALPSYARHELFTYSSSDTYVIPKPYPGPPDSRADSHTRRIASLFFPPNFFYKTRSRHVRKEPQAQGAAVYIITTTASLHPLQIYIY